MNNKGFTLIELLATIMLLAIIMSVTTISIISIITSSKEKSYELLVEDIKIAAQGYFEECAGSGLIPTNIDCASMTGDDTAKSITTSIQNLVTYGFLKTTATDNTGNKIVNNPKDDNNIGNCNITITKNVNVTDNSFTTNYIYSGDTNTSCPTDADYNKNN